MIQQKYKIAAVCSLLLALFFSACQGKISYTVEPPSQPTSVGPMIIEADQLLINTKSAVEQGDLEFWNHAGQSYYPALHPSYGSVSDFASEMDLYTRVFDFQCQAVLRYPSLSYTGELEGQVLSLVFTASGNDSYQEAAEEHAVLVPELGIFEVSYLVDENDDKAFSLKNAGFIASGGETLEDLYKNFISFSAERLDKYGWELQIDPCP